MFNIVVLLFGGFVILLNVYTTQSTKQPDNKATRQQNNQTTNLREIQVILRISESLDASNPRNNRLKDDLQPSP